MPRSSGRLFHAYFLSTVFALSSGLLLVGGLSGCTGYQLGTPQTAPLAFSTLYVAPVKMRALIPQADALLTGAVREQFSKDGRLTLAPTPDAAGAVLEITIRNYRRDTATANPDDTGLARKFTLILVAELTLREGSTRSANAGTDQGISAGGTGKTYFATRTIEVRRDIFADGGQQQAEYHILPLLAQDLADKVLHAVLDTW